MCVLFMVRLWMWTFERKTRGKVPFLSCHITLSAWVTTFDVDLEHLTEVVTARFLHYKLLFDPLSTLYSLEKSHYAQPTLKERELHSSLRAEYLHKLLGILLHWSFVSSSHLFCYPIIYFILWVIMQITPFNLSTSFSAWLLAVWTENKRNLPRNMFL